MNGQTKERQIKVELAQCRELMADLFQGGLMTVPEPLLQRVRKEEAHVRQYGMTWLGEQLGLLADSIEKRRHSVTAGADEEMQALFFQICQYLEIGIMQAGLDEAGDKMQFGT